MKKNRHSLSLTHHTSHKRPCAGKTSSLCELPIPNCTEVYQKDGNLSDAIPPGRRKSEDRSSTTEGCRETRPATDNLEKQDFARGHQLHHHPPAGKIARTDGLESPHTRTEEHWHPYGRKIDRMLKGKSTGNSWVFFDHIWRKKAATCPSNQ